MANNESVSQVIKQHGKRGSWKGRLFWLLLLSSVTGGAWYYYYYLPQNTTTTLPTFKTEAIKHGDISTSINATGNLQPLNQVDIGTELSGTIAEVLVNDNDNVRKGQILAKLNTSQLEDAVTKAEAGLATAKSKVAQANAQIQQSDAKIAQAEANIQQAVANAKQSALGITKANADVEQNTSKVKQATLAVQQANIEAEQATITSTQADAQIQQANAQIQQANAQFQQANAQIAQAVAVTQDARVSLKRLQDINRTNGEQVIAQMDIDTAMTNLKKAEAAEAATRASAAAARASLESSKANAASVKTNLATNKSKINAAKNKIDSAKNDVTSANANLAAIKATAQSSKVSADAAQYNIASIKAAAESAKADRLTAEANLAATKAGLMDADAGLRSAKSNLAKATITSPIDGVVLNRSVEAGQTVSASLSAPTLFTVAEDLTKMELEVGVDEADVGQVKDGLAAEFTVDAWPGRKYPATITRISLGATTTNNVVSYLTTLAVNNADLSLRPGMTATATISTQTHKDVLLVPNAALRYTPSFIGSGSGNWRRNGGSGGAGGTGSGGGGAPAAGANDSFLSKLMPRPPMGNRQSRQRNNNNTDAGARGGAGGNDATGGSGNGGGGRRNADGKRVWIVENDKPRPVRVETGLSDGKFTEVTSDQLSDGTQVITEEVPTP